MVWQNCRLYNSRPSDETVREMCSEVEQEFKKLWTKAGLEGSEAARDQPSNEAAGGQSEEEAENSPIQVGYVEIQESQVPEQYNVFQGMAMVTYLSYLCCDLVNAPPSLASLVP